MIIAKTEDDNGRADGIQDDNCRGREVLARVFLTIRSRREARGRLCDPVAAYDRIAPEFARLSEERRAYLDSVNRLIIGEIVPGSRSMLDAGSGDGSRARGIAEAAGLAKLVLLEPSAEMRRDAPAGAEIWAMRAEDLGSGQGQFDAITCLWNVLGHIFPAAARIEVLRQFVRLASSHGKIFIDVNHRYNARHYGVFPTAVRFLRDQILPDEKNGDVVVAWNVGGTRCVTAGHVFTDREFHALAQAAGLTIEKKFVVDYDSGQLRQRSIDGNLLYVLRPVAGSEV